jgi:ribosome-associated toxin RatA of RatAB toxin-antitoxin module
MKVPTFRTTPGLLALVLLLSCIVTGWTGMMEELTPEQQAQLKAGETVVISRDIKGKAWPELTLFRLVEAKPSQVFDLFTDYASAPSYTPGMIAAEVVDEPSKDVKDVRYTVRVPVLSRISYTVRNRYVRSGKDTFEVKWDLLESPMASESTGSLRIEPYGNGTILRYTNHVTPSVPMAGMLKNNARQEAITTIEAIEKEAAKRAAAAR